MNRKEVEAAKAAVDAHISLELPEVPEHIMAQGRTIKRLADALLEAMDTTLLPVMAELCSDPRAVQFFDLRMIERAKKLSAEWEGR